MCVSTPWIYPRSRYFLVQVLSLQTVLSLFFFLAESRWEAPAEGYLSIQDQRNEQNASDQPYEEQVSTEVTEQRNAKSAQARFIGT